MGRLIEIQQPECLVGALHLQSGDLLLLTGSGGQVLSGVEVVKMLGAFVTSVVGDTGEVLVPSGGPNVVLFQAHSPGEAIVEVMLGSAWHSPRRFSIALMVAPSVAEMPRA